MSHPLKRPHATPKWPSYTGTSHYVGTSPSGRVAVYFDPTLGTAGLQNAKDLVADADRVVQANDAMFASTGSTVSVIIFAIDGQTDGTGGADHNACDYKNGGAIEVCASFGDAARVSALFEAELSECSMGGNLCGVSTGEALSRWCASAVSDNALADFATAPVWAEKGMPNYVDKTENSDQDALSTGCGMAFLSWLQNRGITLKQIAPAMVKLGTRGTLAQLYAVLSADSQANAWPKFRAAAQALPAIVNDDPFGKAAARTKGPAKRKAPIAAILATSKKKSATHGAGVRRR